MLDVSRYTYKKKKEKSITSQFYFIWT